MTDPADDPDLPPRFGFEFILLWWGLVPYALWLTYTCYEHQRWLTFFGSQVFPLAIVLSGLSALWLRIRLAGAWSAIALIAGPALFTVAVYLYFRFSPCCPLLPPESCARHQHELRLRLEAYQRTHGRYPPTLEQVLAHGHPRCPTAGLDTYDYRPSRDRRSYCLRCLYGCPQNREGELDRN